MFHAATIFMPVRFEGFTLVTLLARHRREA